MKTDTLFKAKTRKMRFKAKTKTKNSVETQKYSSNHFPYIIKLKGKV